MIAPRIWRIIVMKLFLLLASEIFGLPAHVCMFVRVPKISFEIELRIFGFGQIAHVCMCVGVP